MLNIYMYLIQKEKAVSFSLPLSDNLVILKYEGFNRLGGKRAATRNVKHPIMDPN